MLSITSAATLGAAVLGPTPPTFAKDFYVGSQDVLNIVQGGYNIQGGACCSMSNSPQCKIQAVNDGSDVREQGSKERSRSDSAQGSIVNWFGSINKQMAIVPGAQANSTHKWACAQYCPLTGDFMSSITIGDGQKGPLDKPRDKGQQSITQPKAIGGATKVCEHWQWTETILEFIPMSKTNFFVDMSANPPAPFFQNQIIEPFGGAPLGTENSSYIGYVPSPADLEDYFDIDPDTVAQCPQSDQCNQNAQSFEAVLAQFKPGLVKFAPQKTLYAEAERAAKLSKRADPPSPPARPNVTFAKDFTADEDSILIMNQGGQQIAGDYCCLADTAGQCQVQTQHMKGTRYYDSTNQRARFDDVIANQVQVDDYTAHKSMLINVSASGALQCQEYCPIDPQDTLDPFDPFDPFDDVADLGKATYKGQPAEHYEWKDKIFKVITMQTTEFYADISKPNGAVPLFSTSALTPFGGPSIGTTNETWTSFTAATPSADKFDIAGVATCPQSNNCGQNSKQLYRLKMKQLHAYAKYHAMTAQ